MVLTNMFWLFRVESCETAAIYKKMFFSSNLWGMFVYTTVAMYYYIIVMIIHGLVFVAPGFGD